MARREGGDPRWDGILPGSSSPAQVDPIRRSIIAVLAVAFLLSLIGPSWRAAAASASLLRLERHDEAMGATFSIVLYGKECAALEAAADAAFDEAQRLDQLLSNYQPTSEWSAMNRNAATRPVRVSSELFALLRACMAYSRQSEGAFDITVGPLVKLWGFFEGEGKLAGPAQVTKTLRHVGYRHVRLDPAAQTVEFERPGMELDPGGIGKGYAIDRMVDVLKRHHVRIALLSASGSSIHGMGSPPGEPGGWKVKIRAPRDPRASVAEVRLEGMSISTSGGYEKFFWADGRAYFAQERAHAAKCRNTDFDERFYPDRIAFAAPRFRVLYRLWKQEGDAILAEVGSPALADAVAGGSGRVEIVSSGHRYGHRSPLVAVA